jgi:VanZ family protein
MRPAHVDLLLRLLTAGILAAIVAWSLGPPPPAPGPDLTDKVEHAVAYAALTGSMLLAFVWRPRKPFDPDLRGAAVAAATALLVGIALEIGQCFTGRDADWRDVVADAIGVALATVSWLLLRARGRP